MPPFPLTHPPPTLSRFKRAASQAGSEVVRKAREEIELKVSGIVEEVAIIPWLLAGLPQEGIQDLSRVP
jgi:hypothetical protein